MSYEGYEQHLCKNGHRFFCDCFEEVGVCPVCEVESIWSNPVDETNCESYGIIPEWEWKKLLIKDAVVETCNLGHHHITSEAIYKVPEDSNKIRYYRHVDSSSNQDFLIRIRDDKRFTINCPSFP